MTTKGLLALILIFAVAVGAGLGIPLLKDKFFSTSPSTIPEDSPAPADLTECSSDDQCTWFTKIIEQNSGQPNEQLDAILSCTNVNYTQSCGPDCENNGNVHPRNHIDKCLCNQGLCESDEKAPLE